MKRPEHAEGRDPRNPNLVDDARRKALARGLPYYFTCNMAEVVLFSVSAHPRADDREEVSYQLAPISHSREVEPYWDQIAENWNKFLDDLEARLSAVKRTRPSVTNADVISLRDSIYEVADEAIDRAVSHLSDLPDKLDEIRDEVANTFGLSTALRPEYPAQFRSELLQILRFGIFVAAQKIILYRVLEDAGPRHRESFTLDSLEVPKRSSDPLAVREALARASAHAIARSGDYETAFLPNPVIDTVFISPEGAEEIQNCQVGEVWNRLVSRVYDASWVAISQNLVGLLYEVIVDDEFRHELGQFYTREDVVDILVAFSVRSSTDVVIDPSAGGGSFLRAAYYRKRDLGANHDEALSDTWGAEITAFAAELSTISLATADTSEPAAYPRVMLKDFFDVRPGKSTDLEIPGVPGKLAIPAEFDAVIGNPPYISYRRQTNQERMISALVRMPQEIKLPKFSGKSDAYAWFIVYATGFLREGGRLGFVVSSAVLFSDYGIPLIRFMSKHYRIRAVVDSMVERWFPDADTNTVLLMLERCSDEDARINNEIRFVRLRKPLVQLLDEPSSRQRRQSVEDLVDTILGSLHGEADPRLVVNVVRQGEDGGMSFIPSDAYDGVDAEEEE
ncbi:HsdM family class I SAM-dependent methyltransferase [Amycolatopsis eburnea]|nr:N-6 DNA methylase [Amycolatopsis eburnea]